MSDRQDNVKPSRKQDGGRIGVGIALGASLGVVFGLLVFDNLALGLGLGAALGLLVSSGIDAWPRRSAPADHDGNTAQPGPPP